MKARICFVALFLLSGCAQVQAEAQATLDDLILAREMNRNGIFKAYERCNELIKAEFDDLLRRAHGGKTHHESSFWRARAAELLNQTKRKLLSAKLVEQIRNGELDFSLNCFGRYKAKEYAPLAMN